MPCARPAARRHGSTRRCATKARGASTSATAGRRTARHASATGTARGWPSGDTPSASSPRLPSCLTRARHVVNSNRRAHDAAGLRPEPPLFARCDSAVGCGRARCAVEIRPGAYGAIAVLRADLDLSYGTPPVELCVRLGAAPELGDLELLGLGKLNADRGQSGL